MWNKQNTLSQYKDYETIEKIDFLDFVDCFFLRKYDNYWNKLTDKAKTAHSWVIIGKLSVGVPDLIYRFKHSITTIHTLNLLREMLASSSIPNYWYQKTAKVVSNKKKLYDVVDYKVIYLYMQENDVTFKSLMDFYINHEVEFLRDINEFKKDNKAKLEYGIKERKITKAETKTILNKFKKAK